MESPALRHKNRILEEAAQAAAIVAAKTVAVVTSLPGHITNQLALMLAMLDTARAELKDMKTQGERVAAKRQRYIPMFEQFIAEYLAAGEVYANPVLVWFTLWLFDVRDMERALTFADLCILQNQAMPDDWRRDMQTYAVDETLDWAQQCRDDRASASPYFDLVVARLLSGEWQVNEKIQVRACKLSAEILVQQGEKQAALDFYHAAMRIAGGNAGVKTEAAKLEKELAAPAALSPPQ